MRRIAAFTLIPWLALGSPALAAIDTGLIPSVATADDGPSLSLNPAGMGTDPGVGLHLAGSGFQTLGQQSYLLALALGGGGIGLRHEALPAGDRQEMAFATTIPLAPTFRAGLSYRMGRMGAASGSDWDFGVLSRPTDWLSVGVAARAVAGAMPGEARNYQVGLGYRPVGDRFTLSLDGLWAEGKGIAQATPQLGIELEPVDGLGLRALAALDTAGLQAGAAFASALTVRVGMSVATPRLDAGVLAGGVPATANLSPSTIAAGTSSYFRVRESRGRALWNAGSEILELKLRGNLGPDRSALNLIAGLAEKPAVASTLEVLEQAARDRQVKALAVSIDGIGVSLADIQEVRDGLLRVKEAGKTVVAYLPSGGFPELYLASAADRILINPVGMLDFTGFAVEELYLKGILDKIGVKAEFVNTGPYKTAMEPYERNAMSEANRKQLDELTADQFDQILAGVAQGRKKTTDEIKAQFDRGILSASEALQAGLVDDLQSQDDLEAATTKIAGSGGMIDAFKRPVRVRSWLPPRLAVVYAAGAISGGDSGNDLLMGRILGSDTLVEALKEAREDGQTKAVVLRIDSPGGSALASEAIRREVERTRQAKPVIVSMGGVAASGGYWIACGSDRILADPGTITGSIGVVVGKFSAQDLLAKNDVKAEEIKRGRFSGLGSPFHALTPDEKALLQSSADFTYGRFLELVSHARKMPQHKVKELAGGRVYSGTKALEVGLIDREAGLLEAIDEARMAAGLAPTDEFEIAYMPQQRPFLLSDDALVFFDLTAQVRQAIAKSAKWTRTSVLLLDPRLIP
jgi:protease-4